MNINMEEKIEEGMVRLGYLHIGPAWHGICRYGILLAAEARQRNDLTVIEVNVILTQDRKRNRELLISAARQLSEADAIHIQYSCINNQELWGTGWKQLYYFWIFRSHCSSPLVVTLHDLYSIPASFSTVLKQIVGQFQSTFSSVNRDDLVTAPDSQFFKNLTPARSFRLIGRMFTPRALSLRWLLSQVQLVFVCSEQESQKLEILHKGYKTRSIPHFVEKRASSINSEKAKKSLNLDGVKTVTVLGFIYPHKGHQLVIEALAELPENVKVIFAGGASPGYDKLVESLVTLAKAKGVENRLLVTGYLPEQELEFYLAATDLAVCPFKSMSASGSLSTWISMARPILASDLPQVKQYNQLENNAIQTFHPYTPSALARAIKQLLSAEQKPESSPIVELRKKLSISVIFEEHLSNYLSII